MLRVVDDHTDLNEVLDVAYDRNEISVIKLSNYGIKMHKLQGHRVRLNGEDQYAALPSSIFNLLSRFK